MWLVKAILRFTQRSWALCLGMGLIYLIWTASQVIVRQRFGFEELKAVAISPLVGVLLGLLIAAIARSDGLRYEKKLRIDAFGLTGGLWGFLLGGFVGFIERDGEFQWIGFENNAMVVGCILGLFAGAILMAVIGEVVSPSRPPGQRAAPEGE